MYPFRKIILPYNYIILTFMSMSSVSSHFNEISMILPNSGGDFCMFYERLQQLCRAQNTSVSSMLRELGLSTGSTGNWKRGQLPKGDVLQKIAAYLHTSIDYIVTGEYKTDLSEEEQHLIALYRAVPERARYKVVCDFEQITAEERRKLNAQDAPAQK